MATSTGLTPAIVGVGHSRFAKRIPDQTLEQLRIEAALRATADAGLSLGDIDGLIIGEGSESFNERYHMQFAETIGMPYAKGLCMTSSMGGSSPGLAVEIASWALAAGRCKHVLIVHGRKESEAGRSEHGNAYTDVMATLNMHYPDYELPYGPLMASFYGVIAARHKHEFGTTDEQLSAVSVATRYNASLNPAAVYRERITIENVLNSPMISTPLRRLHSCIINDGAAAFVMSTAERAADLAKPPVLVRGHGAGQAGYFTGYISSAGRAQGYDLVRTIARRSAEEAFAQAGVTHDEIDLVTCSDGFAIKPIVLLEDFGFCAKGEGGQFVEDWKQIAVGGRLPVNPHGGNLSCNHAATNYMNYVEAVQQLRNECGDRQVAGAQIALASCHAGVTSTGYTTILSM